MLKWLDHEIIYPFFDSEWVSSVEIILKKGLTAMIRNK